MDRSSAGAVWELARLGSAAVKIRGVDPAGESALWLKGKKGGEGAHGGDGRLAPPICQISSMCSWGAISLVSSAHPPFKSYVMYSCRWLQPLLKRYICSALATGPAQAVPSNIWGRGSLGVPIGNPDSANQQPKQTQAASPEKNALRTRQSKQVCFGNMQRQPWGKPGRCRRRRKQLIRSERAENRENPQIAPTGSALHVC